MLKSFKSWRLWGYFFCKVLAWFWTFPLEWFYNSSKNPSNDCSLTSPFFCLFISRHGYCKPVKVWCFSLRDSNSSVTSFQIWKGKITSFLLPFSSVTYLNISQHYFPLFFICLYPLTPYFPEICKIHFQGKPQQSGNPRDSMPVSWRKKAITCICILSSDCPLRSHLEIRNYLAH